MLIKIVGILNWYWRIGFNKEKNLIIGDGVLSKVEYVSLIFGYMVDLEVVKVELREVFMIFDKLKWGYLDLK